MPNRPSKKLETFSNPNPDRDYEISFECPEFTCLCPRTGQPDFATIRIRYIPDKTCVELKSLKLYLWSYRNEGVFHEKVTNQILDDLVRAVRPRTMTVTGDFYVRGGIHTVVTANYCSPINHRQVAGLARGGAAVPRASGRAKARALAAKRKLKPK